MDKLASAPIIANFEAEKVGPNDQSYVRQGRLSSALPARAGTGQNRKPVLYGIVTLPT